MTTLAEKIAVMQAFERGEKIECAEIGCGWSSSNIPIWDWEGFEYRIAKPEPKSGTLVTMLITDGEIRFALKDSPAHENLIHDGWKHISELDSEITLP